MNQNQHILSLSNSLNNINYFSQNLNPQSNSLFINNKFYAPNFSSLTLKNYNIIKKRNYNDLMESYKKMDNNSYNKENEELCKTINKNFQKKINKFKYNYENKSIKEKIILNKANNKNNKNEKEKEIKFFNKKFLFDDDEKFFERDKKVDKKFRLSKSYLYEEESGFYSDLDNTKENSFLALDFSLDYPELNLDNSLKDKLITNAIELEKTFNRFFNVKNIPNKR